MNLAALRETIGDKKIRRILGDIEKFLGSSDLPLKLTGTLQAPKLSFTGLQRTGSPGEEKKRPIVDPDTVKELFDLFGKKRKKKPE